GEVAYSDVVRLERLPGWVIDNDVSVRDEVAPFVGATMAARWEATRRCCRAAATMLRFHRDPERALAYRDPLPESAVAALRRLRSSGVQTE
ncbi:MAG TPA: hypothetical protein VML75_29205, partial [Kofleriaceae bacterium]|nr:hypothetical protein [Kofleriaceae bacterium]